MIETHSFIDKYQFYTQERAKSKGWLGIKIMCPSGTTCLSADCCFRQLALYKSN